MEHESNDRQRPKNLTVTRAPANVWERPGWMPGSSLWDRERLAQGAAGGALGLIGARRGGWLGGLLALAGAGLAIRAGRGSHDLSRARVAAERAWRTMGFGRADLVQETSEESFPASDAPSWTPTAGAAAKR